MLLNMGFVCHWQRPCIMKQRRAMRSSLNYANTHNVPNGKVQLCNRQSSRNGTRKEWVGFNRCIRKQNLRRSPFRMERPD